MRCECQRRASAKRGLYPTVDILLVPGDESSWISHHSARFPALPMRHRLETWLLTDGEDQSRLQRLVADLLRDLCCPFPQPQAPSERKSIYLVPSHDWETSSSSLTRKIGL